MGCGASSDATTTAGGGGGGGASSSPSPPSAANNAKSGSISTAPSNRDNSAASVSPSGGATSSSSAAALNSAGIRASSGTAAAAGGGVGGATAARKASTMEAAASEVAAAENASDAEASLVAEREPIGPTTTTSLNALILHRAEQVVAKREQRYDAIRKASAPYDAWIKAQTDCRRCNPAPILPTSHTVKFVSGEATCSELLKKKFVKSSGGSTTLQVSITNKFGSPIVSSWLSGESEPTADSSIPAGASALMNSAVGHMFLISTASADDVTKRDVPLVIFTVAAVGGVQDEKLDITILSRASSSSSSSSSAAASSSTNNNNSTNPAGGGGEQQQQQPQHDDDDGGGQVESAAGGTPGSSSSVTIKVKSIKSQSSSSSSSSSSQAAPYTVLQGTANDFGGTRTIAGRICKCVEHSTVCPGCKNSGTLQAVGSNVPWSCKVCSAPEHPPSDPLLVCTSCSISVCAGPCSSAKPALPQCPEHGILVKMGASLTDGECSACRGVLPSKLPVRYCVPCAQAAAADPQRHQQTNMHAAHCEVYSPAAAAAAAAAAKNNMPTELAGAATAAAAVSTTTTTTTTTTTPAAAVPWLSPTSSNAASRPCYKCNARTLKCESTPASSRFLCQNCGQLWAAGSVCAVCPNPECGGEPGKNDSPLIMCGGAGCRPGKEHPRVCPVAGCNRGLQIAWTTSATRCHNCDRKHDAAGTEVLHCWRHNFLRCAGGCDGVAPTRCPVDPSHGPMLRYGSVVVDGEAAAASAAAASAAAAVKKTCSNCYKNLLDAGTRVRACQICLALAHLVPCEAPANLPPTAAARGADHFGKGDDFVVEPEHSVRYGGTAVEEAAAAADGTGDHTAASAAPAPASKAAAAAAAADQDRKKRVCRKCGGSGCGKPVDEKKDSRAEKMRGPCDACLGKGVL